MIVVRFHSANEVDRQRDRAYDANREERPTDLLSSRNGDLFRYEERGASREHASRRDDRAEFWYGKSCLFHTC